MSAEAFERIGREATKRADELRRVARQLARLEESTSEVVGGTATGTDKKLIAHLQGAASGAEKSAQAFSDAAAAAKRAAQAAAHAAAQKQTAAAGRARR